MAPLLFGGLVFATCNFFSGTLANAAAGLAIGDSLVTNPLDRNVHAQVAAAVKESALDDVNLGEDATKAGFKECGVDGSADVFNAGICHDGGCVSAWM